MGFFYKALLPTSNMKKPLKAETEVFQKALREIQSLSNSFNPEDPKQVESRFGDLELKISALRSFICVKKVEQRSIRRMIP